MKQIVVTEPIHQDGLDLLARVDGFNLIDLSKNGAEAGPALLAADAILVRTMKIDAGLIAGAKNLGIIAKHGVGCDNIDLVAASERRIPVAITADANTNSVVEHTFALMLAVAKRVAHQDAIVRSGDWVGKEAIGAVDLVGKTILIIGLGRIGQRISRICDAFGMKVLGYSRRSRPDGITVVDDLETGLAAADFVTLHVPLSTETKHMIDAARIAQMKPGAILINCARGGVVDENAVLAGLNRGQIGGLGTDVFEVEPPGVDHLLLARDDVVLSPHAAAMSAGAQAAMAIQSAKHIIAHFSGALDPNALTNKKELGL